MEFHRPMMIIALRSCKACKHIVPTSVYDTLTCDTCGDERTGNNRIKVFESFDKDLTKNHVTTDFVNWMREHSKTTFIAHNMKGSVF